MSLRVGIVGRRASAFAEAIKLSPDAELAAMCDIDADLLKIEADRFEIPLRFTEFEGMLEHVDAVLVATPMHLHAGQSITALEAGKAVLSEVTACVSLEECRQLVDAVERTGGTYMMSENYCYSRDAVLVRELARKGFFGEVYYGEGEYLHDVKPLHHFSDGRPTWRMQWQVGTRGNTYPTHSLGPVMQWIEAVDSDDRPASIVCFGSGIHTDPEHPHDDTTVTLVQTKNGRLVSLRLDMMSNRPHQVGYYALQGTTGVYEASRKANEPGSVWFGKNPVPGPVEQEHREWRPLSDFEDNLPEFWRNPPEAAIRAGHSGGDYFVIQDFIACALGRAPNPIDVYRAAEWTAVGLCSQQSILTSQPVAVPSFRKDKPA